MSSQNLNPVGNNTNGINSNNSNAADSFLAKNILYNFDKDNNGRLSDQEVFDYIKLSNKGTSSDHLRALNALNGNVEDIKEIFDIFGKPGSKNFSNLDIMRGIQSINKKEIEFSSVQRKLIDDNTSFRTLRDEFMKFDKDGNGLSDSETLDAILEINSTTDKSKISTLKSIIEANPNGSSFLYSIVKQYDQDNNGKLSEQEIKLILQSTLATKLSKSQLEALNQLIDKNDIGGRIRAAFEADSFKYSSAYDDLSKQILNTSLGMFNNLDLKSKTTLSDVLKQMDIHFATQSSSRIEGFSPQIFEIRQKFIAAGYQDPVDFNTRTVELGELKFLEKELSKNFKLTETNFKASTEKLQNYRFYLEQLTDFNAIDNNITIGRLLEGISNIFGDGKINVSQDPSNPPVYPGITGSIQKDIFQNLGITNLNQKFDKYILNRLKTNLNQKQSFDTDNLKNLKNQIDTKTQVKTLTNSYIAHLIKGDLEGAKTIMSDINLFKSSIKPLGPFSYFDNNILIHNEFKKFIDTKIGQLGAEETISLNVLKDQAESSYGKNSPITNSILSNIDGHLITRNHLIDLSNNFKYMISLADKELGISDQDRIKRELSTLYSNGAMNFLGSYIKDSKVNLKLSNALILNRFQKKENKNEIFRGLDLLDTQKDEIYGKLADFEFNYKKEFLNDNRAIKFLADIENFDDPNSHNIVERLELLANLENIGNKIKLSSTNNNDYNAIQFLNELSNQKLDSGVLNGVLNGTVKAGKNIFYNLISNLKENELILDFSDNAKKLTQLEIDFIQSSLRNSLGIKSNLNLDLGGISEASSYIKQLLANFTKGDLNTVNKTNEDILKKLAEIFKENSNYSVILASHFNDDSKFHKEDHVSFESLSLLNDSLNNILVNKNINLANFKDLKEKQFIYNKTQNLFDQISMGTFTSSGLRAKPNMNELIKYLQSHDNTDSDFKSLVDFIKKNFKNNNLSDINLDQKNLQAVIKFSSEIQGASVKQFFENDKVEYYSSISNIKKIHNLINKSQITNSNLKQFFDEFKTFDSKLIITTDATGNLLINPEESLVNSLYHKLINSNNKIKADTPMDNDILNSLKLSLESFFNAKKSTKGYLHISKDPSYNLELQKKVINQATYDILHKKLALIQESIISNSNWSIALILKSFASTLKEPFNELNLEASTGLTAHIYNELKRREQVSGLDSTIDSHSFTRLKELLTNNLIIK